jgi:hypothetical protein
LNTIKLEISIDNICNKSVLLLYRINVLFAHVIYLGFFSSNGGKFEKIDEEHI